MAVSAARASTESCKHCRGRLDADVSRGHGGLRFRRTRRPPKYMKVPVSTLVPLPDSLSFVTGAAISCGTGTAWGALRRLALRGG